MLNIVEQAFQSTLQKLHAQSTLYMLKVVEQKQENDFTASIKHN